MQFFIGLLSLLILRKTCTALIPQRPQVVGARPALMSGELRHWNCIEAQAYLDMVQSLEPIFFDMEQTIIASE